jgi:hypothetical protein
MIIRSMVSPGDGCNSSSHPDDVADDRFDPADSELAP